MKKIAGFIVRTILPAMLAVPVLCSCGDDNDEPVPAPVPDAPSFANPATYTGISRVKDLTTGSVEDVNSSYTLTFDTQGPTVNVMCNGAKFSAAMPRPMDILIPDIPLLVDGDVDFSFAETGPVTPQIGGTPYPTFPISLVRGSGKIGTGGALSFSFNCEVNTPAFSGRYQVTAMELTLSE